MALEINFNVCQTNNCQNIKFYDITDAYNANDNQGGYGAPNDDIPVSYAAGDAVLVIDDPNGDSWSIDITAGDDGVLNSGDDFPSTDITRSITLTPELIGQTETFTDGLYTFTYTYTAGNNVYTKTKTVLLDCNVKCCVNKMLADLADNDCNCDDDITEKVRLANLLYYGMKAAARCGNVSQVATMIKQINKLCGGTTSPCNCN